MTSPLEPRPRHASEVRHARWRRLWWAVEKPVAYIVVALALLAGVAITLVQVLP